MRSFLTFSEDIGKVARPLKRTLRKNPPKAARAWLAANGEVGYEATESEEI